MAVPTWVWVVWVIAALAVEIWALLNQVRGDTLSEKVWLWASTNHRGTAFRVRRFFLLVLMCWLTVHFMTGGFV